MYATWEMAVVAHLKIGTLQPSLPRAFGHDYGKTKIHKASNNQTLATTRGQFCMLTCRLPVCGIFSQLIIIMLRLNAGAEEQEHAKEAHARYTGWRREYLCICPKQTPRDDGSPDSH